MGTFDFTKFHQDLVFIFRGFFQNFRYAENSDTKIIIVKRILREIQCLNFLSEKQKMNA